MTIIEIGEDNTPRLAELETAGCFKPSRQFAAQAEPGRYYFANVATYCIGLLAEISLADSEAVNGSLQGIAASIREGHVGRFETSSSGNPLREFEIQVGPRRTVIVHVGVLTAHPLGIHCPTDPELHQFFAFLSRCHPLD